MTNHVIIGRQIKIKYKSRKIKKNTTEGKNRKKGKFIKKKTIKKNRESK